ncbi:hypothetical protein VQ643_14290 [Pseudomonas sp. F1_0610]|uniref:hypothetical protein n=1 Tax=Pseudomonas sp. F1_0610 TaxID=3114284 RepID=UPI0039C34136
MLFLLRQHNFLLIGFALSCLLWLSACSSNTSNANLRHEEITGANPAAQANELLQTDVNRLTTISMRNNLHGLYQLLTKFYKRNPREWRKIASTQQQAEELIHQAIENNQRLPWLENQNSIEALYLALDPSFQGDRAGTLIYAQARMIIDAHGGHTKFYISDVLNAEFINNSARNIEMSLWVLRDRKDAQGQPLLLSNEISEKGYNVSFAMEYAKIIARLDLAASVLDERFRRLGVNYVHSLLFLTLLPIQ